MKNNPNVIIQCDFCGRQFAGKDIFHYSAIINGELYNHLHICKFCFSKLGLKLQELDITHNEIAIK